MSDQAVSKIYDYALEMPSKGLLYGEDLPGGCISGRILVTRDEKVLGDAKRFEDAVNVYLERALTFPKGMNPLKMLLGDRLYGLFMVRAASYGPNYEFEYRCPECGKFSPVSISIPDIPVKYLADGFTEPFFVDLPVKGDTVGLRLFRGEDQMLVDKQLHTGKVDKDGLKVFQLTRHITHINGEQVGDAKSRALVADYVARLQFPDTYAIEDAIEEVEPGLDLSMIFECKALFCRKETPMDIPIQMEFFRPSRRKPKSGRNSAV